MKFAVVEYSSKSGDIWQHRAGRPNYLEDPARVIDPTSFGCYVSALGGQHIPLTKFAGGRSLWRKSIKRLTGSWPSRYQLDYFAKFDVLLVVHQISDAHEMTRFVTRLKRTYPHVFIIGVPTQPYGLLRRYFAASPAAADTFKQYLKQCDLFITVVKATEQWYKSLSDTPVVYLPQIYPAHYATRFHMNRSDKEKSIFVAGVTDRPTITQGFRVARELQREFTDYIIHAINIPGIQLDVRELSGARYELTPFDPWREHLPWLARHILTINTDYTFTRGRVQVDCAAVGTPSLGGNSDGQTDLFPELASTPTTPFTELVAAGRRLIQNADYYQHITQVARTKLAKYDYEESAARLMMLVTSFKRARGGK
jgi:hypothetical protein